ncbi:MAG: RidA family protein [Verrucomicrobia bacterium]|nr:RidA family protein [Verrucomicrobiota bacterium]
MLPLIDPLPLLVNRRAAYPARIANQVRTSGGRLPRHTPGRRNFPVFALGLFVAASLAGGEIGPQEIKRFPAGTPGLARAVRVDDVPLAHTAMMLGWDGAGAIKGDARTQAKQALKNADVALAAVGSSLTRAVKLNFYLARDEDAPAVDAALAEMFADRPVAAAWVTTALTDPAALVGVDAVATAPGTGGRVQLASARTLPSGLAGAHVAVLPPGQRIFFSGDAASDKDLRGAARKTMESLGRTLEWMKATKADVVQVKAFLRPFAEHKAAAEEMAAFFASAPVPTCVLVEWATNSPVEIEMTLAGRPEAAKSPDGIAFLTPPGVTASPAYARIATVDAGHPLIFISGLYGQTAGSVRREWLDIFGELGDILWETGSSIRYQVKGTYYSTTQESRRLHGEIRRVYFDPARPPASSGMMTKGVGRPGRTTTIDMIAMPVPPPAKPAR